MTQLVVVERVAPEGADTQSDAQDGVALRVCTPEGVGTQSVPHGGIDSERDHP